MLLLAMSFVGMAGIFATHGLTTPGFLVDGQYWAVTGLRAPQLAGRGRAAGGERR